MPETERHKRELYSNCKGCAGMKPLSLHGGGRDKRDLMSSRSTLLTWRVPDHPELGRETLS